jgi:hypothetical protein
VVSVIKWRFFLVTDSVMEIINRQRVDQEQMLRALSSGKWFPLPKRTWLTHARTDGGDSRGTTAIRGSDERGYSN